MEVYLGMLGYAEAKASINDIDDYRLTKDAYRDDVMSDDDKKRIDDYIVLLNENVSYMQRFYNEWSEIEDSYLSAQDEEEDMPNSRMNIIVSAVEGLVSQLVDRNLSVIAKGEGPEDHKFSKWGMVVLDWALRKNQINRKVATHERRRSKFGNGWFKVVWCEDFAGGFGLPKIMTPALNKIFVDTKVKDFTRIDEADYIAETINCSKSYAYEMYSEEKACLIDYGFNQYRDNGIYEEDDTAYEGDNEWTLIQWWSICKGKLRLQEFSGCGVLLWDSHKSGDRTENQKHNEYKEKSFYKYVYDRYPYFFTSKYPQEGSLFGIGDGKLLLPLQKMLNEIYDKIRIQMRPNLVAVDVQSNIKVNSFDDNSYSPVYFDGAPLNGRQPVHSIPWGQIGQEMWQLIMLIHEEAQRIVRFSDIMIGQGKSADTATESAIMQQQGNSHTDHEKANLEITIAEVCKYMLGLMMEKYTEGGGASGKAFRITGTETDEYAWIDFNEMANVPAQIPATKTYREDFAARNPESEVPKWMNLENKKGKAETKSVELDIEISIGSGLPKNKAFIWQMIEKLSQMTAIDMEQGQPMPKPAVSWKELRAFIKDYLGIPISQDVSDMDEYSNAMRAAKQQIDKLQGMGGNNPGAPRGPQPGMGGMPAQTPLPQANAPLNQEGGPQAQQPQQTIGAY